MRNDAITLDTNVLEHFFNPDWNGDGHIASLLGKVITLRRNLCFDDGNRLAGEMAHRLSQYRDHPEQGNFQNIVRGLAMLGREIVKVHDNDGLMNCISGCVPGHTETSDKVIIFVACVSDTLLVSNNPKHITKHAPCLKKCAKGTVGTTPEFWDSGTANNNL